MLVTSLAPLSYVYPEPAKFETVNVTLVFLEFMLLDVTLH